MPIIVRFVTYFIDWCRYARFVARCPRWGRKLRERHERESITEIYKKQKTPHFTFFLRKSPFENGLCLIREKFIFGVIFSWDNYNSPKSVSYPNFSRSTQQSFFNTHKTLIYGGNSPFCIFYPFWKRRKALQFAL